MVTFLYKILSSAPITKANKTETRTQKFYYILLCEVSELPVGAVTAT